MDTFHTPRDISTLLKVHYQKVLELIALGKLEAYKIDGSYRISSCSLTKYLLSVKVKSYWKKQ